MGSRKPDPYVEVVERLRKTRDAGAEQLRDEGHAYGIAWANGKASYDELEQLVAVYDAPASDPLVLDQTHSLIEFATAGGNLKPVEKFVLDTNTPWAEGFIDGAIAVWDNVKDRI